MYPPTVQYLSMVYCTVSVSIHSIYIFFSLSTCQQCSYIFCVLICLQIVLIVYIYSILCIYFSLQCSFIYSTAPIYLLCKDIFIAFLSKDDFLSFLLCITTVLNIYTEYMYTVQCLSISLFTCLCLRPLDLQAISSRQI